jgi:hypothetical protein
VRAAWRRWRWVLCGHSTDVNGTPCLNPCSLTLPLTSLRRTAPRSLPRPPTRARTDNPPKLLPCNHVLCEQSIQKIARSRSRVLKCPYCPMEARPDNTRTLIFPDVE